MGMYLELVMLNTFVLTLITIVTHFVAMPYSLLLKSKYIPFKLFYH